ncbi:MAG: HD family phosphohydrolase [Bacteroidales bacterium]|nr:HD family phosphohydrolase [Bacteroidales bacterium]
MANKTDYKEEFCELLRSTGRDGIDEVIEYLESVGFFKAPASASHHLAVEGGLVEHSVNTCRAALAIWESMSQFDTSLQFVVKRDNVIIAALLHDVCKSDSYEKSMRRRKNDLGQDEMVPGFKVVNSALPIGHGEKSLVMLLYNTSLDLTNPEMLAIRWHMGPWGLNFNSGEETRLYDAANDNPLVPIIYAADLLASRIIERTQ